MQRHVQVEGFCADLREGLAQVDAGRIHQDVGRAAERRKSRHDLRCRVGRREVGRDGIGGDVLGAQGAAALSSFPEARAHNTTRAPARPSARARSQARSRSCRR